MSVEAGGGIARTKQRWHACNSQSSSFAAAHNGQRRACWAVSLHNCRRCADRCTVAVSNMAAHIWRPVTVRLHLPVPNHAVCPGRILAHHLGEGGHMEATHVSALHIRVLLQWCAMLLCTTRQPKPKAIQSRCTCRRLVAGLVGAPKTARSASAAVGRMKGRCRFSWSPDRCSRMRAANELSSWLGQQQEQQPMAHMPQMTHLACPKAYCTPRGPPSRPKCLAARRRQPRIPLECPLPLLPPLPRPRRSPLLLPPLLPRHRPAPRPRWLLPLAARR